jgi:hypothetical protein
MITFLRQLKLYDRILIRENLFFQGNREFEGDIRPDVKYIWVQYLSDLESRLCTGIGTDTSEPESLVASYFIYSTINMLLTAQC